MNRITILLMLLATTKIFSSEIGIADILKKSVTIMPGDSERSVLLMLGTPTISLCDDKKITLSTFYAEEIIESDGSISGNPVNGWVKISWADGKVKEVEVRNAWDEAVKRWPFSK